MSAPAICDAGMQKLHQRIAGALLGVTLADLSPTTNFMLLGLNWLIVKFVIEQIYFVQK